MHSRGQVPLPKPRQANHLRFGNDVEVATLAAQREEKRKQERLALKQKKKLSKQRNGVAQEENNSPDGAVNVESAASDSDSESEHDIMSGFDEQLQSAEAKGSTAEAASEESKTAQTAVSSFLICLGWWWVGKISAVIGGLMS